MTEQGSGTSIEDIAATVLDLAIAVPAALAVYLLFMPLVALGTGVVRGFSELHAYANGERGMRLLEPHYDRQRKQLEALHRPWRETAQPVTRDDA